MNGQHTLRCLGYTITYWMGTTACGDGDPWNRAVISSDGYYPKIEIETQYKLIEMMDLLNKVFRAGKTEAKQEIRDVLGVPRISPWL